MILHWKKHNKAKEYGANFSYHVVLLDESENEAKGQLTSDFLFLFLNSQILLGLIYIGITKGKCRFQKVIMTFKKSEIINRLDFSSH